MKNVSPLAGQATQPCMLANIPRLVTAYYTGRPDPSGARTTGGLWDIGTPWFLVEAVV